MTKTKIDFKSIPTPVQKPLYAGVGAGDLAVTAVLEYVADVQKRITGAQKDAQTRVADVQKTVTTFDAKALRDSALDAAKARRSKVEARVTELQAEATSLPTKVTGVVTETYADLAKRGEALVKGTKLPSSATVEVKVNSTNPAARTDVPATPATPAKKAPAKKAPAKKTTAKKAPAKKSANKSA